LREGRIVLSATARLAEGDPTSIRGRMAAFREKRAAGQPKGQRSAGCIFKNPPGDNAGRLIDAAGLKGARVGDAEVSQVHANFLVNRGQATSAEFRELMECVQAKVREVHGVDLQPEVEIWG
ncbi:MAG TPA: hypothetical protein VN436_15905, partial [Holophaga sp.]|nr:hypothetical protein [Holophaga sp.]